MLSASPRLMTIFNEALDQPDAAAQAAYLDQACGEDAELRRRVEALLAAHRGAGRFLDLDPTDCAAGPRERPGPDRRANHRGRPGGHGHRRALHAPGEDRRRRHGRGLGRQADRAGQAQGRPQADQDRAWIPGPCSSGSSKNARRWR